MLYKIPLERRDCRFPHEKPENFTIFDYYSYTSCIFQCQIDHMLNLCNCVPQMLHSGKYKITVFI
ncbi:hypothetical protein L9F63_014636 [Diploptera punctata]|uniref:Uncharacterized protein n=1 Tax=Diploptera punctata TaxID=6984 RepID=A0AAD8ELG8_DIPPU|nr:hypothetical protein L9F63_014636 [Diploptera punctata]